MSVYPQQYPYNYQYPVYYQVPAAQPIAGQQLPPIQYPPNYYNQIPQAQAQIQPRVTPAPPQGNSLPIYYYNNINEKKGKLSTTWTAKEDKLLRELKEQQKLGWRDISTFFNDRTPNACQFRWRRIISSITKTQDSKRGSDNSDSRSSSISSISSLHSNSSSISSVSSVSSNKINKKSHHSINYILN